MQIKNRDRLKKLKRIANRPSHIPLIHNYCDRWCERCTLSARCSVFAMEREEAGDAKSRDPANREFWDRLFRIFADTLELLREKAEELGVDLNALPTEAYEARTARVRDQVEQHELARAGMAYMNSVDDWFDSSTELFKDKMNELSVKARLELPGTNPEAEVQDLNEAAEVIQWYQAFIGVKLRRAVHGEIEGCPAGLEDLPKDSDGSAKVALIAIDRSIAAWARMREHLPEKEDAILDFLVALERLRRGTERAFPNARAFVRPGFDEPGV